MFDWKLALEIASRLWDAARSYGAPYNSDEFIQAHADALNNITDFLPHLEEATKPELKDFAKQILRQIAAVVEAYHRKTDVHINANYMIPERPTPELRAAALFTRPGRDLNSFSCFLVLKEWAHPPGGMPERLVLPVEAEAGTDELLFGAPRAFVNDRDYMVNDTAEMYPHFQDQESSKIRGAVAEYFKGHGERMRSFVSFPVPPPGPGDYGPCARDVIAVVNVQSTHSYLLGFFKGNQAKLRIVLTPFLHALAQCLVRVYYSPPTGADAGGNT